MVEGVVTQSVMLGGTKYILEFSSKTYNEAVRGDMGLETLQSRRYKAKLKWYKLANMLDNRYLRQLFDHDWAFKPHRGKQRKAWDRIVNDLFVDQKLHISE